MHPYAPRPIRFHGVREHGGWRIKAYSIVYGAGGPDWARFREARELAMAALPRAEGEAERPGVAFTIAHQGRNADYFVLGWWDRENELPLRVFVRDGEGWRPARGSESICVWDLQVLLVRARGVRHHADGPRLRGPGRRLPRPRARPGAGAVVMPLLAT